MELEGEIMFINTIKIHEPMFKNSTKKQNKEIKSDNYCYRNVKRAISIQGAIAKIPILR